MICLSKHSYGLCLCGVVASSVHLWYGDPVSYGHVFLVMSFWCLVAQSTLQHLAIKLLVNVEKKRSFQGRNLTRRN